MKARWCCCLWAVLILAQAACRGDVPASLLLTVTSAPEAPAVNSVRVQVFDRNGRAHDVQVFAAQAPGGARVGTLVIYPRDSASLALRVHAQGLASEAVVSSDATAVVLRAGQQTTAEITLHVEAADGRPRPGRGTRRHRQLPVGPEPRPAGR